MKVRAPTFQLKGMRCPCLCGGEGELVFETCPSCGHIGLFCAEIATFFPDPRDLRDEAAVYGDSQVCPNCGGDITKYRPSTNAELEGQGFDYG